jgi:hypothetical protein
MNGGAPGALARAVQSVADIPPLAATWVALIAGLIVVMIVGLILSAQFLGQRQRAS